MKQKYLFVGIFGILLIFMMVLAGCGYDGPSADEIANAVNGKLNDPNTDEIAFTVWEQSELRECSHIIEQLVSSGRITITKGIQAWGQTDAAYTFSVNTAERTSFYLPDVYYNNDSLTLKWEGDGNDDVKRSDYNNITVSDKSNGKTANFNFTFTNLVTAKTVKGVLTVTTVYDTAPWAWRILVNFLRNYFHTILTMIPRYLP